MRLRERGDRLLRISDVRLMTAFGRSTIYRKISEGTFPEPIRFSANVVRWRESAIQAWIDGFGSK
ncbi:helix-turn-helix transcriptional regulator [Govanella unica]|uniref:AlpA family phage regulatory protein n=1 Tax=Govanella unica TaxID=2975056 RepID=A0A9X3TYG1_9PROT|nr:AlpA family phage regulatory protein [Govania unica]MDA5193702.1 AlpA family phage regulatory protein [Govania unica]